MSGRARYAPDVYAKTSVYSSALQTEEYCEAGQRSWPNARTVDRRLDSPQRGPLRVGVVTVYASLVVEIIALDEFLKRFPGYRLVHVV